MVELGCAGAQRQKSEDEECQVEIVGITTDGLTAWAIEVGRLAIRILVFSGGVADIVAELSASDKPCVCVNFFWLQMVSE
jgi:hypothetical protein